jgi:hypothetical protein
VAGPAVFGPALHLALFVATQHQIMLTADLVPAPVLEVEREHLKEIHGFDGGFVGECRIGMQSRQRCEHMGLSIVRSCRAQKKLAEASFFHTRACY